MRLFLHTLNTWFLSLFIMIATLFIYEQFTVNKDNLLYIDFAGFLAILFFSSFMAIPSFLIAWNILSLMIRSFRTANEKFFLWYLVVISSVAMNILLLSGFFLGDVPFFSGLQYCWPVYPAAFMGVTIRYKQFFNLIHKTQDNGNN